MARKTSKEILAEIRAEPDDLPMRRIGVWSLEKLATLHLYLPAFARACQRAGGGYYVDGFAGPGRASIRGAPEPHFVYGSPLIALRANPQIKRCIFLEIDPHKLTALEGRCSRYGDRAFLRRGDVNVDLVPLLRQEVPGWAPCFCFLDPTGVELKWQTVEGIARLPGRRRKPELMILFPLEMSVIRLLTVDRPMRDEDKTRVNAMFKNESWWDIYQSRVRGEIDKAEAKRLYLAKYSEDVKSLGYESVESRQVLAYVGAGKKRQARYHLVFATDHPVGEDIMSDIFKRDFVLDFPVSRQPSFLTREAFRRRSHRPGSAQPCLCRRACPLRCARPTA